MVPWSWSRSVRRFFAAVALVSMGMLASTLVEAAGCPTNLQFVPDGISNYDIGWFGFAHYISLPGWSMRLGVTSCAGNTVGSCGACAISSILPAADGRNRRCSNDTSIVCVDDAPCAGDGGHCAIYAAPPTTFDIRGVTSCVLNEIVPPVTGTVAVESGELALTMPVQSTLYYIGCPVCDGDAIPNDGIAGGTCQGGLRGGLACDANAGSPIPGFGSTSFDCTIEDEDIIGSLAIPSQPLSFSTGVQTRVITTDSPICSDGTGRRCHCETCNNAAATPCSSNADCVAVGASVCGGKRCSGGPNAGTPCSATSECPGSGNVCGYAGQPSQPNHCLDDTATPVDGKSCPDTAPVDGEGECVDGPIDKHCSGIERHLGCSANLDCPATHLCVAENFACFPGGAALGATVPAAGTATARVGDVSDPTNLATIYCGGPQSSGFNGYAALPGLVRLTLAGSLTYDDAPVPTPTPTATPGPCPPAPAACRGSTVSGKSTVTLIDKSPDTKDQVQWKWASGAATTKTDFGNPLTADDYVVCLYDGSGLRAAMVAPRGGTCGTKPCWKDQKKGFLYKTNAPVTGGLTQIQLLAGSDGKARIAVKGKGAALPDVPLTSLASPVTLQIRRSSGGVCFGTSFGFPPAVKITAAQFKDKGD